MKNNAFKITLTVLCCLMFLIVFSFAFFMPKRVHSAFAASSVTVPIDSFPPYFSSPALASFSFAIVNNNINFVTHTPINLRDLNYILSSPEGDMIDSSFSTVVLYKTNSTWTIVARMPSFSCLDISTSTLNSEYSLGLSSDYLSSYPLCRVVTTSVSSGGSNTFAFWVCSNSSKTNFEILGYRFSTTSLQTNFVLVSYMNEVSGQAHAFRTCLNYFVNYNYYAYVYGLSYNLGYQAGLNNNDYNQGYQDGLAAGDIDSYENGYRVGYTNGYNNGLKNQSGDAKAWQQGYNAGFAAGEASGGAENASFMGLISAVVDAPIKAFTGLLNFEVFGVNLETFLLALFSIALILSAVRLVL